MAASKSSHRALQLVVWCMGYFAVVSYPLKALQQDPHERGGHQRFGHVRWTFAIQDDVVQQISQGRRRAIDEEVVRRSLQLPTHEWFSQRLLAANVPLSSRSDDVLLVGFCKLRNRCSYTSVLVELSDEEQLLHEFLKWPLDFYTCDIESMWVLSLPLVVTWMFSRSNYSRRRHADIGGVVPVSKGPGLVRPSLGEHDRLLDAYVFERGSPGIRFAVGHLAASCDIRSISELDAIMLPTAIASLVTSSRWGRVALLTRWGPSAMMPVARFEEMWVRETMWKHKRLDYHGADDRLLLPETFLHLASEVRGLARTCLALAPDLEGDFRNIVNWFDDSFSCSMPAA
jgi:hypothetical protein